PYAAPPAPPHPEGDLSLTDMLVRMRQLAESCTLTGAELDAMYQSQLESARREVARLGAALERANADPRLEAPESSLWANYYDLDARYRWWEELRILLLVRAHTMACETHGPPCLSYRGLLTGEGVMAWQHPCFDCAKAQIAATKARLLREHRRAPGAAS
ncbi:MAG TPA: hypothetical protein VJP78_09720, partial [Thermoleophilia bacterium]|nr:hypothetical protein [Thermoleophilia bacterium]